MRLTITIAKGEEYFIGTTKEIPAVMTQVENVEKTRDNMLDALRLYLKDMQQEDF